ncbi:MAG: HEAT repeat domain-containing protein [Gemmataceae bacterium]
MRFLPEVAKYLQKLMDARVMVGPTPDEDNSNTQFATIAIWLARKHGVPVNEALDRIEKRFRFTQNAHGGWSYNPTEEGSPAMYCAGLIGLATGIARREERRTKPEPKPEPKKTDPGTDPKKNPEDPFFNPKTPDPKGEPKKNAPPRLIDPLDRATHAAFAGLGQYLVASVRAGQGSLLVRPNGRGKDDLYFLWSLERMSVLYGVEKIGGVNWYESGAHTIVHLQAPDGSWSVTPGDYGSEVDTAFAVLFLCKSNLARDLSGKVQKETSTEMKAGLPTGTETKKSDNPTGITKKDPEEPPVYVPPPVGNEVATLTAELLKAGDSQWAKVLAKLRDGKGGVHTQALTNAVHKLDGEKRREAREALAERLTRMNGDTLRGMAKAEDPELRRAAVLAMAMKDEKAHIPDLVAALTDEEDFVVRAARAGLRSLAGEDFGPEKNATAGEKQLAAKAWQDWIDTQKK